MSELWDPASVPLSVAAPAMTLNRIRRDLQALADSPLDGIIVSPDETSLLRFHALVLGAEGTPYHGGFFLFQGCFPADYPASPPKLKLLTTGGGTTRMGPNLYANGKVCLSLLGTWAGDPWSPTLSIGQVLLSIQAMLMTRDALRNEPGHEATSDVTKVEFYDAVIRHHVLSVAVIDTVTRVINSLRESLGMPPAETTDTTAASAAGAGGGAGAASSSSAPSKPFKSTSSTSKSDLPSDLQEAVLSSFISLADTYSDSCDAMASRGLYEGPFEDPMWKGVTRRFAWREMKARINDVLLPSALEVSEEIERQQLELEGEGEGAGEA